MLLVPTVEDPLDNNVSYLIKNYYLGKGIVSLSRAEYTDRAMRVIMRLQLMYLEPNWLVC